jgi:hypothetical protein
VFIETNLETASGAGAFFKENGSTGTENGSTGTSRAWQTADTKRQTDVPLTEVNFRYRKVTLA